MLSQGKFELPQGFGSNVTKISQLLATYEASLCRDDKVGHELLICCCNLLQSIDLISLEGQLSEILSNQEVVSIAINNIIADAAHFSYFLNNVERVMLANANVGERARDDIIIRVEELREKLVNPITRITSSTIIDDIMRLRDDVCGASSDEFERRDTEYRKRKAKKTILISLIIVNAVGSALFAPATPAALAASVIVGGTASYVT
ncbi:MAG: hypothetical protein U1E43_02435 [Rhodospirillales bacterium]